MQDAGAAAIELNIYYLPGDRHTSGRDVEQRHVDVLTRVKDAVDLLVAVKLSRTSARPARWRYGSTRRARTRSCCSIDSCNPISTRTSSRS
jgi:hypothetical protein